MESKQERRYSELELGGKFVVVTLIEAVLENDKPAFYYLAIKGNKLEAFKKAAESRRTFDLADYGTVVFSGYGRPTEEIIEFMEKNYGVNHADAPKLRLTEDGLKEIKGS